MSSKVLPLADCKSILESLKDIVYEVDSEGNFTYFNSALVEYTGYSKNELFELGFKKLLGRAHLSSLLKFYRDQCKNKVSNSYFEFPITRKSGSKIWFGQNLTMSFDNDGSFISATAVARECSGQGACENNIDYRNECKKHETSAEGRDEFLSTLSHEIRTPLNAVIGMSHLLLEENPAEHQIENLNTLKFSAHTLLSLINNILDFNKIASNKITLESIPFDFYELIENIRKTFSIKADEKGILLKVIIDTSVPKILNGDPVRVTQILSNLLSNAIKFTSKGFVKLKVFVEQETAKDVFLNFSVEDTGIGIAKDRQTAIFERFTQAGTDTSRKFGGTGLGLAITKMLIELHGYSITLKSTPKKGSLFQFHLNFTKTRSGTKPKIKQKDLQGEVDFSGVKVLVVEDNEINQVVIRKYLHIWKAAGDIVCNGYEALSKISQQRYDIVLMDIQMAEMDGYQTAREIRKLGSAADVPILALTADADADVRIKVRKAGMNGVLVKPIDHVELKKEIAAKLSKGTFLPAEKQTFANFNRIEKLADGDHEFYSQILESYINELNSLKTQYSQALNNADKVSYNQLVHKTKSALIMIEANLLLEEVKKGAAIVESKQENEKSSNVTNVEYLSSTIIEMLRVKQHNLCA